MDEKKARFIDFMLEADVLRFGSFVTKSGRKTPYFINTGNYRTGKHLCVLGQYYARLIEETAGGDFTALFGPAYKGIPLVSAAAEALYREYGIDRPYLFNRKETKDHGEGGSLIGYTPKDGDTVLIVEDVVTAGTALRETLPLLLNTAKVKIPYMFISVDRSEIGTGETPLTAKEQIKEEFGIEIRSLVTVYDLHEYLQHKKEYAPMISAMEAYMDQYCR